MNILTKTLLTATLLALLLPTTADARTRALAADANDPRPPTLVIAQRNGMTLSQAVESVRRRGNVERVISAETRVSNGREVHVIKVLTRDGRVQTHRVPGRQRN